MIIVVFVITFALPLAIAFDAKMVIGHPCQFAVAATGFKQTLRQRNACRYTIKVHFLYSNGFKMIDVFKRGHRLEISNGVAVFFLNFLVVTACFAIIDKVVMYSTST